MAEGFRIVAQVGSFAVAVAKHAGSGFAQADDETKRRRLELCHGCEHLTPEGKCRECGCVMSTKAGWQTSACPLGKW